MFYPDMAVAPPDHEGVCCNKEHHHPPEYPPRWLLPPAVQDQPQVRQRLLHSEPVRPVLLIIPIFQMKPLRPRASLRFAGLLTTCEQQRPIPSPGPRLTAG